MSIAILIPVCSRNQSWERFEDCYLIRSFMPRFEMTKTAAYKYQFYVGIDDDDAFFLRYADELRERGFHVHILTGCQHAPARAWNQLFELAVKDTHEYFFQIGDDVILQSRKWTERFIGVLQSHGNKGVVGPCHPNNFWMRKRAGGHPVIENSFVHRSHHEIFGSFFPPEIPNWYCDNWITEVYRPLCAYTCEDIIVQNQCVDNRYLIQHMDIQELVRVGRSKLFSSLRCCFSFCLFGNQDKYRKGLIRNVGMIREQYPTWDIQVYVSPECVEFARSLGITVISTGHEGVANTLNRFHALFCDYDVVCIRDADSRIHARDRWCIDHFMNSSYTAYTTRDHPFHTYSIMAGLWGVKRGHPMFSVRDINSFMSTSPLEYISDAVFLERNLNRKNFVVYSYDPEGIRKDTSETVCVIEEPIRNQEFCGNVMLFKGETETPEFTHPESIQTNG